MWASGGFGGSPGSFLGNSKTAKQEEQRQRLLNAEDAKEKRQGRDGGFGVSYLRDLFRLVLLLLERFRVLRVLLQLPLERVRRAGVVLELLALAGLRPSWPAR